MTRDCPIKIQQALKFLYLPKFDLATNDVLCGDGE